jgi:DNA-binding transcriptional LysR family regulator
LTLDIVARHATIAPVNLERLRYFKLLAERGHAGQTAELVGLSPSALSRSIKALEGELGVQLFQMNGKRLVLSERGRALYPWVDRLLGDYASLRTALVSGAPEPAPTIRFCSHSVFTTYFLGSVLRHHLPTEEVFIRNLGPGGIEESVAAKESDFGLTYLPVPTPGLEFIPVTSVAMAVFVRRGAFKDVPFDRIPCSAPILRIANAARPVTTVDSWPDAIARGTIRYHVDLLETALESCRQGLSWGYFPLFVAWLHNAQKRPEFQLERLRSAVVPHKKLLPAFLVKREGDEETTPMKRMCSALRSVCKEASLHLGREEPSPARRHGRARARRRP